MSNYAKVNYRDPKLVDHFTIRRYSNVLRHFSTCCDIRFATISTALCSWLYSLITIRRISYHDPFLVRHFARRFRTLIALTDTLETHKSTHKETRRPSFRPTLATFVRRTAVYQKFEIYGNLMTINFLGYVIGTPRDARQVKWSDIGSRINGRCHRTCIAWHMSLQQKRTETRYFSFLLCIYTKAILTKQYYLYTTITHRIWENIPSLYLSTTISKVITERHWRYCTIVICYRYTIIPCQFDDRLKIRTRAV